MYSSVDIHTHTCIHECIRSAIYVASNMFTNSKGLWGAFIIRILPVDPYITKGLHIWALVVGLPSFGEHQARTWLVCCAYFVTIWETFA